MAVVNAKRITALAAINWTLVAVLSIMTIYPFWYMIVVTFSDPSQIVGSRFLLLPQGFSFDSVSFIFRSPSFLRIYGNTLIVVGFGTVLSMVTTVLIAYALSRRIPFTRAVSYFVYFTILFHGGMIPTYIVVRATGLLNSLWALMLPQLLNPFFIFLMRNFFTTVPNSLIESAELDGAGVMTVLMRIVLPTTVAGLATISLFYAVASWNRFFDAVLYITSRQKYVLQVLLREVLITVEPDSFGTGAVTPGDDPTTHMGLTVRMATVTMAVIPVMAIYPFVQKYFIKGIMIGAVKE